MGVVLDVDGGGAGIQACADARAAIPALRAGHILAAARGLFNVAAGDVNGDSALLAVGFAATVAAAADAGTGSLAGPVLFAAALSRDSAALDVDDGAAVAAVAAADARSGGAALGSNFCCTLDEDVGVALGSIAAADACAATAAKGGITAAGGLNGHAVVESDVGVAGGVTA